MSEGMWVAVITSVVGPILVVIVAAVLKWPRGPVRNRPEESEVKSTEPPKRQTSIENRPSSPGNGSRPSSKPAKEFNNSIGMKFVWIPPGTFLMGSPPDEPGRRNDETQHRVTLTKGFYIGVHQVTQAQWHKVLRRDPSYSKGANLPVESISWDECREFCEALGKSDGKKYRLPTEAEWEYACRAGSTTPFHFGDDSKQLGAYAWYSDNTGPRTNPVGVKPPNAWGLYDMHGNVWEWCADWHGPYPEGDSTDPQGPDAGEARVLRGGSWKNSPWECRSAYRHDARSFKKYHGCVGCRVCFYQD